MFAILNSVIRKALIRKRALEQRGEETSQADIWRKNIRAEEMASAKVLRQIHA
jgi:hypothetical protein